MKVDYVLLGTRIKEQRQRRTLTQQQLAEKVNLTPGFISRIETGNKKPSLEVLLSICVALNITLNNLLVGNQIPQENDYNTDFFDYEHLSETGATKSTEFLIPYILEALK